MQQYTENLLFNINRLKWANGIRGPEINNILGISIDDFNSMQFTGAIPDLNAIISLADYFNISLEDLISSKMSLSAATKNKKYHSSLIPEKYALSANSKVRTVYHIINHLELTNKSNIIDQFLSYADVPYQIFNNLENQVSIELVTDLCNWLKESRHIDLSDLYNMGLNTYEVNKKSLLAQNLSKFKTVKELYLFQIEEFMGFFDKNAHYRIKNLNDTSCVIAWKQNQEVAEGLKKKVFSSINVEIYQMGVAASFPMFMNLPSSAVKMKSSLQYGDSESSLDIDFSKAHFMNKNRLKIIKNNYH